MGQKIHVERYFLRKLPSHKEECAEVKAVDSKSGKILSLFRQPLYALQLHYHVEAEHKQALNQTFRKMKVTSEKLEIQIILNNHIFARKNHNGQYHNTSG